MRRAYGYLVRSEDVGVNEWRASEDGVLGSGGSGGAFEKEGKIKCGGWPGGDFPDAGSSPMFFMRAPPARPV